MLCQESLDGGSSHLLTINPTLLLGQYSLLLGRRKVRQSQGFVRRHLAIGMRITQANATCRSMYSSLRALRAWVVVAVFKSI
jgi:hypothetical protein